MSLCLLAQQGHHSNSLLHLWWCSPSHLRCLSVSLFSWRFHPSSLLCFAPLSCYEVDVIPPLCFAGSTCFAQSFVPCWMTSLHPRGSTLEVASSTTMQRRPIPHGSMDISCWLQWGCTPGIRARGPVSAVGCLVPSLTILCVGSCVLKGGLCHVSTKFSYPSAPACHMDRSLAPVLSRVYFNILHLWFLCQTCVVLCLVMFVSIHMLLVLALIVFLMFYLVK